MTQPSVNELRKILVNSGKFTKEEVETIKGKSKLSELVLALEGVDEIDVTRIFDEVKVEAETSSEAGEKVEDDNTPTSQSPDWQDYVLAQFTEKELDGGYPNLVGLRRVARKLVGPIVSSVPKTLTTIVDERNPSGRTTCVYEIVFSGYGEEIRYGSAASASALNTDDEYAAFPEAIAESRAESRTLRKALNLKIVSKDELTDKKTGELVKALAIKETERSGNWSEEDPISVPQEIMVNKLTERLGIDLGKFLKKENLGELSMLKKSEATRLIDLLNKYTSNNKESIVIPNEIKKQKEEVN